MDFLLINPTSPDWRVQRGTLPRKRTRIFRFSMLSSLYVAAAMPPSVKTTILDEDVEGLDFDAKADLVGISFMTYNAPRAYQIADEFRNRGRTVIVGGYHPSLLPEEAAMHADAVCVGEAETNAPRMIADFLAGSLQKFYRGGPADLSQLPVPNRKLLRNGLYAPVTAVQATRGCRHRCRFCSVSSFFGHQFRTRPVDDVLEELGSLGRSLLFMDDNLIADPDYAKELFARMIPMKKRWYSQCPVAIAYDDELLGLAVRSGCRGLFLGLESLSDANLTRVEKTSNRAHDYEWVIRRLHGSGISVAAGMVFGYDSDTVRSFPSALDFLLRTNADVLQATILTPFPGTPLYDEMKEKGRITDTDWSHYNFSNVVFDPARMSADDLRRGHAWILRQFYSRKGVGCRMLRSAGYLPWSTIFDATLPLNLSYRARLTAEGTIRRPDHPF